MILKGESEYELPVHFNQETSQLVASLPGNRLDLAKAAVECGADVVKVHMNVQHRASGLHFGTFEEEKETLQEILSVAKGPCGIVAGNSVQDVERDYRKAFELGFSFVSLYSTAMPLSVLATPALLKWLRFRAIIHLKTCVVCRILVRMYWKRLSCVLKRMGSD